MEKSAKFKRGDWMIFSRKDRKVDLSLSAKMAVLGAVIIMILGAAFAVYDGLSARVTIKNGGSEEIEVLTFKKNVEEVLEEQGISLGEHDRVNCGLKAELNDNMTIEIYRAMQVSVTVGGETRTVYTTKRRVEDILADAGYECTDEDDVTPGRKKIAKANTQIVLVKNTTETVTVMEEVPFSQTERPNNAMSYGTKKVVQEGVCGQSERTYKISYTDGVETGREIVAEKTVSEATPKIVEVGTKKSKIDDYTIAYNGTVTTSRSGELSYSRVLNCSATAYDAVSCGKRPGEARTATGAIAKKGVIAVDPRVIPLGTRVYIEGYGYAVAADTGGAIKGNRIDLCFDTNSEAVSFGRRNVKVYILN